MPVTSSIGYAGTVDETDWARYAGAMGARYTVAGPGDLAASVNTAQARTVRIAPGVAVGCGVIDTVTTTDVQLPVVSSGSRWFLIVLKRVWGATKASTITFVNIPQTGITLPTRATTPGTEDDQPIALALVSANQAQVQNVIDTRVWATNGGAVARDDIVRQYLTQVGSTVTIGNVLHVRQMAGNTSAAWVSYDLSDQRGTRPSILIARDGAYNQVTTPGSWLVSAAAASTETEGDVVGVGMSHVVGNTQTAPTRLNLPQAGLYAIGFRVAFASTAALLAHGHLGVWAGSGMAPSSQVPICTVEYGGGSRTAYLSMTDTRWVRGGTQLGVRIIATANVSIQNWRLWATWLGN